MQGRTYKLISMLAKIIVKKINFRSKNREKNKFSIENIVNRNSVSVTLTETETETETEYSAEYSAETLFGRSLKLERNWKVSLSDQERLAPS